MLQGLSFLAFCAGLAAGSDETSFALISDSPYSTQIGSQTLVWQSPFANSWDTPQTAAYTPSIKGFNRVVLELQVNTTGSNYDRLGQIFVDDIEIWRTSTAEPDGDGVTWKVTKDVSHYGNLFTSPRNISILIQNRVTGNLAGTFYATLTAHFFNDPDTQAESDDSWLINLNDLPDGIQSLSKKANTPSVSWSAPGDDISFNIGPLDRSVGRAVLHIFASGNGDDEFWWDSSHQKSSAGPSRFIDAYVGNELAGFAAPYPVIFTGGVTPYLWKPMVNLRTFDLPAYFIDITPFLPALWGGQTPISLNVTNGIDAEPVPSNWIVNYNLLTWSTPGDSNSGTTHKPDFSTNSGSGSTNSAVLVDRNLTTTAALTIGGKQQTVTWNQNVAYNNTLQSQSASNNYVWQATKGSSSISGLYNFSDDFSFPFQCAMENSQQYRVQQSYDVTSNGKDFENWIDTSVTLDGNGHFQSSQARQYVSGTEGNHFAETQNLNLEQQW